MKKTRKYNYRKVTVTFDLDIDDEKILMEWLKTHKGKRSGYCAIMKKALAEMIERNNSSSNQIA